MIKHTPTLTLKFESIEVFVEIGIHDFEKNRKQRMLVDIDITLPNKNFEENINNTLDYDTIRNGVLALGERIFLLQETLCQEIIALCFKQSNEVFSVRVFCRKTDVYPETASVGIEMTQERPH